MTFIITVLADHQSNFKVIIQLFKKSCFQKELPSKVTTFGLKSFFYKLLLSVSEATNLKLILNSIFVSVRKTRN